jgi:hypothetical protein
VSLLFFSCAIMLPPPSLKILVDTTKSFVINTSLVLTPKRLLFVHCTSATIALAGNVVKPATVRNVMNEDNSNHLPTASVTFTSPGSAQEIASTATDGEEGEDCALFSWGCLLLFVLVCFHFSFSYLLLFYIGFYLHWCAFISRLVTCFYLILASICIGVFSLLHPTWTPVYTTIVFRRRVCCFRLQ